MELDNYNWNFMAFKSTLEGFRIDKVIIYVTFVVLKKKIPINMASQL